MYPKQNLTKIAVHPRPRTDISRALQWRAKFSSHTKINSRGRISYYQPSPTPRGNLVLIPGLASNCASEPLMQNLRFWGLQCNYAVYSIDTFLGDFKPNVSIQDAQKNTVSELVSLINQGLHIVENRATNNPTHILAHSAGATATTNAITDRIANGQTINLASLTLFAPFTSDTSDDRFDKIKRIYQRNMSDAEFYNTPIPIGNPFVDQNNPHIVSVLPTFFEQLGNLQITPDRMQAIQFPVTIVAGGRDTKVRPAQLSAIYNRLRTLPNGKLFQYTLLPRYNHSFFHDTASTARMMSIINIHRQPQHHR